MQKKSRSWAIVKRVAKGTWNDGFIHAGNLAYMSMLAIFPFFILGAAGLSLLGNQADQASSLASVLSGFPRSVRSVIQPVVEDVVTARHGWLLWAGVGFGLWTVTSLVETLRDILRRAYGTPHTLGFWFSRLVSAGLIVVAVILVMASLFVQVAIGAAQEIIAAWFPQLADIPGDLALSRLAPALVLLGSFYLIFLTLTPAPYRQRRYPKWPGALAVTVWSALATWALPRLLRVMVTYNVTYGSLAGIMIALFFFWLVGLGMVVGAELNAAFARTPEEEKKRHEWPDAGETRLDHGAGE